MPDDPFSPRKVGRQSRARDTVDAIVQASRQIVSRDGVRKLTTNRIAELAGVSVGSLYQYFPGKDAVIQAVIERDFNGAVDGFVDTIRSIDRATVPLDVAVRRIVDRVFDAQVERGPFYRAIRLATLSFAHLRFTLDNDARVLAALREKLGEYGDEVDAGNLELATFVLLYSVKGVQIGVVFREHPPDDRELRAMVVRMALACLRR